MRLDDPGNPESETTDSGQQPLKGEQDRKWCCGLKDAILVPILSCIMIANLASFATRIAYQCNTQSLQITSSMSLVAALVAAVLSYYHALENEKVCCGGLISMVMGVINAGLLVTELVRFDCEARHGAPIWRLVPWLSIGACVGWAAAAWVYHESQIDRNDPETTETKVGTWDCASAATRTPHERPTRRTRPTRPTRPTQRPRSASEGERELKLHASRMPPEYRRACASYTAMPHASTDGQQMPHWALTGPPLVSLTQLVQKSFRYFGVGRNR